MAEGSEKKPSEGFKIEEKEHGMKILQGLNKLKNDKVLCDVTLIAEGIYINLFTVYIMAVF